MALGWRRVLKSGVTIRKAVTQTLPKGYYGSSPPFLFPRRSRYITYRVSFNGKLIDSFISYKLALQCARRFALSNGLAK